MSFVKGFAEGGGDILAERARQKREDDINKLLENNDVMVRIGHTWYCLDEIHLNGGKMPIFVSDEDGGEHEFDMADIDEFDPVFEGFRDMDKHIVGIA